MVRSGSRTVLIDAGVGDIQRGNINGGQLLGNLAAMGVTPADIDAVVFTHMHFDHMGWASKRVDATYQATFPKASYRAHQHELDYHYSTVNPMHERFAAMATGFESRIETYEDGEEIAPGVTMVLAAGHTPGSSLVVLASRGQRGILLGDTMHCPAQVQHPDWGPMFDVDPVAAHQIRETLVRETAGDTLVGAAHFPNLSFGRLVSSGTTRIWSAVRPTSVL